LRSYAISAGDDVLYNIYQIDEQIKILVSVFSYCLFIYFYIYKCLQEIYIVGNQKGA